MRIRNILIVLAILLALPFTIKVKGGDFGQGQSLFTDIKAHKVGDILSVLIIEQTRASNQIQTKIEKSSDFSTKGGPGLGPFDFIPLFGAQASNESSHDGKGKQLRNGNLRAKMSVTVVSVKPNGDLIIKGSRQIGISGDRETLTLTGVVRQKDIAPDNSIDSYLIADAEIHYSGKGNANTVATPGFVSRVLNWIF